MINFACTIFFVMSSCLWAGSGGRSVADGQDVGYPSTSHKLILTHMNAEDVDFRNAELSQSELSGSNFKNGSFVGADLRGARLLKTNLQKTNFEHANVTNATIIRSNLTGARFKDAKLVNTNLSYSDLTEVDLTSADVSSAVFLLAFYKKGNDARRITRDWLREKGAYWNPVSPPRTFENSATESRN